jgi:predicted GNAT family acetyltransferase
MHLQNAPAHKLPATSPSAFPSEITTSALTNAATSEVLDFLSQRPLENVMLIGFIIDNGLVSSRNRGTFYGCRNRVGELEGVALIGHITLMETRTDRALTEFAALAAQCNSTHMIMGESDRVREFWSHYSPDGQQIRKALGEHLMKLRFPLEVMPHVDGLRRAKPEDLDLILPVHAQMALEESGVDPLETDPIGFCARSLRRIENGRTWVWIESGELIFKAEVISDTPDVIYLEGVWTNPGHRAKGYGRRCLIQLARQLLSRKPNASVCVFVNKEKPAAIRFYERAGFKAGGAYDTAFLRLSA